jgi:hypothetical protein
MRIALRLFLGVLLITLASVASAGGSDKLFSISTSQATLLSGATNVPVTVTFRNDSPGGNSIINSIKLAVPLGVTYTVTSVSSGTASPSAGNGGDTISINGISGVRPGKTFVVSLTVSVPANSTCSAVAWVGSAWTGNSFGGDAFAPSSANANVANVGVGCDGILPCASVTVIKPAPTTTPDQPGYAATTRAFYNKDGTTNGTGCVPVPYSFADNLLDVDATKAHAYLKWLLQDTAVFTTSVNSALRAAGPSGVVTAATPKVAWLTDTSANPVFILGPSCLGTNAPTNVPAPYGTLTGSGLPSSGAGMTITINTTGAAVVLPPVGTNLPITIGHERIEVSVLSSTSMLVVTRQSGGTPPESHAVGSMVMSTPLPLLVTPSGGWTADQLAAGYAAGLQAQMCVLEGGWASGGVDTSGQPLVYDFATVIDIGDGWVLPK